MLIIPKILCLRPDSERYSQNGGYLMIIIIIIERFASYLPYYIPWDGNMKYIHDYYHAAFIPRFINRYIAIVSCLYSKLSFKKT